MLARAWTDDKVLSLQRFLRMPLPHVMGHLEALYHGAYENVPPSGRLTKRQLQAVETWAMWEGAEGRFLRGLGICGLLQQNSRGPFLPKFAKNVPDYVRKRWANSDLGRNAARRQFRNIPEHSGLTRQDKTGAEQTGVEGSREEKQGKEQQGQAPPAAPPASPPATTAATDNCASSSQLVCSVLLQRLRTALAQQPPAPLLILLIAAGLKGEVAKTLIKNFPEARIRQACHFAARTAKDNPAGLVRSAIEHAEWDLT